MIELTYFHWMAETSSNPPPADENELWTPPAEHFERVWIRVDSILKIEPVEKYGLRYSDVLCSWGRWERYFESPEQIIKLIDHARQWNKSISINVMQNDTTKESK